MSNNSEKLVKDIRRRTRKKSKRVTSTGRRNTLFL